MADEEEELSVTAEPPPQEPSTEEAVAPPAESGNEDQEKTEEKPEQKIEENVEGKEEQILEEGTQECVQEEDEEVEGEEESLLEGSEIELEKVEEGSVTSSEEETISAETDEELFGEDEGADFVKHRKHKKKRVERYGFHLEGEVQVSGDFVTLQKDVFGSAVSPSSILSFHEELEMLEGEEEKEEEDEEVEEIIPVDRVRYYLQYRKLLPERNSKRIKNNFLQRKIAEYFKKRKMDYALKEYEEETDSQEKYEKKLDELAELTEIETRERNSIMADVEDMRIQRDEHQELFDSHFGSMQHREKEVGNGLINTKTGKPLSDKVVERLIRRQKEKMLEISKMRLVYIKLRNAVTEKKMAIHKLNTIGDNLQLIDYEQLKMENTSHTDKVEERDEELVKLRVKCSGSMQCLAHVREKSAALQIDLVKLTERFEEVKEELTECRERLNYVKQQRDNYRTNIRNVIDESGLLTKPNLLIDMEESMEQIKTLESQLKHRQQLYEKTQQSLRALKINIKNFSPTKLVTKKSKTKSSKDKFQPHIDSSLSFH